jgi:enoyl-CoA hydratase
MADTVIYEARDGVAVLRLDDGKANALGPDVFRALHEGLDRAEKEGGAVLLAGRPGRFSAGFDLNVMRSGGPEAGRALVEAGARFAVRLARHPAPVVIGCTGHALAMGAVLLMAADSRIGARGDFKLGFNEVAISMTTPRFLMEFARERISKRHLLRATVQAEIYAPELAVDAGFLDRTAPPDRVIDEALAEAARLGQLPRGAFCATRARARDATLDRIEAELVADVAGLFGAPG